MALCLNIQYKMFLKLYKKKRICALALLLWSAFCYHVDMCFLDGILVTCCSHQYAVHIHISVGIMHNQECHDTHTPFYIILKVKNILHIKFNSFFRCIALTVHVQVYCSRM
jgi:hypothetical protein